jgi:integrase/recombinase XerD
MATRQPTRARLQWKRHIARFCDVWLRASNRSEKTVHAYRADLKQFAKHLPKSVGPRGVRRPAVEGWVARLQKQGYAASSIRRKLASLRAFYGYAVGSGRAASSPLDGVRIRLGAVKRLTRVVPRHDLRALVAAGDRQAGRHACRGLSRRQRVLRLRNSLVVRLLCVTGVRVGELVSLRLGDVRQRERTLVISGKGSRERLAYVADPHTASLLDRYVLERSRCHAARAETAADALFPGPGGSHISTENVRTVLRALARLAETPVRVTPHMLRHTAATTLLENGADLRVVQEFLGHDSIRSTERYTHVAPTYLRKVLRRTNPLKRVA